LRSTEVLRGAATVIMVELTGDMFSKEEPMLKRILLCLVVGAVLAGCRFKEERFMEESLEASCVWIAECLELFETADACIEEYQEAVLLDFCEYDPKAAKECVKALQELTCDDTEVPDECNEVYFNCDCDSGSYC
jgi:hypothetical protein